MIFSLIVILIICSSFVVLTASKCPEMKPPCFCQSSLVEPIIISCRHSDSWNDIESSLDAFRNETYSIINQLTIEDTKLVNLPKTLDYKVQKLRLRRTELNIETLLILTQNFADQLIDLDLSQNGLDHIPNILGCFKRLTSLNLSKNNIRVFNNNKSLDDWSSKRSLISLDLSSNFLDDSIFDTDNNSCCITHFENLRDLNLAGNMLTKTPRPFLTIHNGSLINLNLASNKINNLHKTDGWDTLENLRSLNLEFNNLTSMDVDFLGSSHNSLNFLYLLGNKLPGWSNNICKNLPNLKTLTLSSPYITEFPNGALSNCQNLVRLEMPFGFLESLHESAFTGAANLHAILLNNNKLKRITRGTFFGLSNLYSLDLSRNQIANVEDGTFAELPNLKHLDLSYNRLQTLEPHTFDGSFTNSPTMFASLYLCENQWICDDYLDWLRKWTRENIDINLDKSNSCVSMCSSPDWLKNWPIRFPNPPALNATPSTVVIKTETTNQTSTAQPLSTSTETEIFVASSTTLMPTTSSPLISSTDSSTNATSAETTNTTSAETTNTTTSEQQTFELSPTTEEQISTSSVEQTVEFTKTFHGYFPGELFQRLWDFSMGETILLEEMAP